MKKILMALIIVLSLFGIFRVNTEVKAAETKTIENNEAYFRGVWVTNLANDVNSYKDEASFKKEMTKVLDVMEYFNLNALIFHIRTHNNAMYQSDLNPRATFWKNVDFSKFDPLEWLIDETHKRGIEFHAWLNPYRISVGGSNYCAEKYPSVNPASNPDNLLVSTSGTNKGNEILNPGLPNVREFIIDTCMEVIEKYNVDAIHFDDYFYIENVNDDDTYAKYNPDGLNHDDWRREQVNIFIRDLAERMRTYNEENNRHVQLGISPSGIWRSADGVVTYDENGNAITKGSKTTSTFQHYEYYLYSDTLKWVNEEWIDYILPQTYWGISHPSAAFKPLMDWWNAVVKYKNVNLYSGMGLYMSENKGSNYSWGKDPKEAYNQIQYTYDLENACGTSIYKYSYLLDAYNGQTDSLYGEGMTIVRDELYNNLTVLPEVRTMERVTLPKAENLNVEYGDKNTFTFDKVDGAKFYAIYRNGGEIDWSNEQLYDIIGPNDVNGKITFVDEKANGVQYGYGVKVISGTNTLSEGSEYHADLKVVFKDYDGKVLATETVKFGETPNAPTPSKAGATFVGWSRDITHVTHDMEVTAKYTDSDFIVKFYDINGEVIDTQTLKYLDDAVAPDPEIEGYDFLNWSEDFTDVKTDLDVYPNYQIKEYSVIFKYTNPLTNEEIYLSTQTIKYNNSAEEPDHPTFNGFEFTGWSESFTNVKSDLEIEAIYKPLKFTVTFVSDIDGSVISEQEVEFGKDAKLPDAPVVRGYTFIRWNGSYTNVQSDRRITAIYELKIYIITFKDYDGTVLDEIVYVYGDEINFPTPKGREGYEFTGWDKTLEEIQDADGDIEVNALYAPETPMMTVKYLDKDGNLLKEETVIRDPGYEPNFEAPSVEGFEFDKWVKEIDSDGNIIFTATYKEVSKKGCKLFGTIEIMSILTVLGLAILLKKKRD